jgi:alkaline phosphatase
MLNRLIFIFLLCSSVGSVLAQPAAYTTANAHSHNDYEQPQPFWEAYRHGFGSIEADIFLLNNEPELLVAHTLEEIAQKKRRLDSLYLLPLIQCLRQHGGYPFADTTKKLQLLIDVKTIAAPALQKLVETLERYPELSHNPSVRFAISGNRPAQDSFQLYPACIVFDAELKKDYSNQALQKVVLMSANLKDYTSWNGTEQLPAQDKAVLAAVIRKAHDLYKPVRFWGAPDSPEAWRVLMDLGVDYINTDHIAALSDTLNKNNR